MSGLAPSKMSAEPVTAVVIGAGNRGTNYATYAEEFPDHFKIVGVADPREFQRKKMQKTFNIPQENVFESWEEVAKRDKFADCVIITTPDRLHKDPAVAFADKGYHILLEKPMSISPDDCIAIVEAVKRNNTIMSVCHVLRYSPQAFTIKQLIKSGVIGQVVNIQHLEPIGCWHFAHSYVRGNWKQEKTSSFSLLTKSCHDIDLISWWMEGSKCTKVSSFGSLYHFRKENKPAGAGSRCFDCSVEDTCPYSAKKVYIDLAKQGHWGWPIKVVTDVPDIENLTTALKTGPYGVCVYGSDNDVVDNQVVNMEFDGGQTASFSMVAFTEKICQRSVKVFGTKGELRCDFEGPVYCYDFLSRETSVHFDMPENVEAAPANSKIRGHGGSDFYTVQSFVKAVARGDRSLISTGPEETLSGDMLVFAAEKARRENRVINPQEECLLGYFS